MEIVRLVNLVFVFVLGTAIGSFLNVLIDRLSNGEKITGRSKCDHCRKQLAWYDLIPIVSFITLGGKCRYCHKKLSVYYPFVELLTGVFFILITQSLGISSIPLLFIYFGIISCLIVIFFADFKYQIIPDSIQLALFVIILFFHLFFEFAVRPLGSETEITDFILAGVGTMLPILFLWWVTKGRGMGFGDVKLAFNIGFLLGFRMGLIALYISFIFGAIVGMLLIVIKKKHLTSKIAFGPFLVIGIIIMVFFQREIWSWVSHLYGY